MKMLRIFAAAVAALLFFAGCVTQPVPPETPVARAPQPVKVQEAAPPAPSDQMGEPEDLRPQVSEEVEAPLALEMEALSGPSGPGSQECYRPKSVAVRGKSSRCEPQCIPFARCRSGISSCRLGRENGPLTWFACEKKLGNTSPVPKPGSLLVFAANKQRKMPTGHIAYVEEVVPVTGTRYRLIYSHTNYDRKCSLETGIEATYDSASRTIDVHSGNWKGWGKRLVVAGFILN